MLIFESPMDVAKLTNYEQLVRQGEDIIWGCCDDPAQINVIASTETCLNNLNRVVLVATAV